MRKLLPILFMATLNFAPLLAQDNAPANPPRHKPSKDREIVVVESHRRHHRHHRRHHHRHHHHRAIRIFVR